MALGKLLPLAVLVLFGGCVGCDGSKSSPEAAADGGRPANAANGGAAGTGKPVEPSGGVDTSTTSATSTSVTPRPLTERHPDEESLLTDPSVLFYDDFEDGWGKWDSPSKDSDHLFIENDSGTAHAGARYLRSTVTESQLASNEYISSSTRITFSKRVDTLYWRFYARFKGVSPTPHHWVRVAAGTEAFNSSGLANTVPSGDEGFWFDFDANTDDVFNFYVYWYKMRSGRCNDGTATPGCAGDQGTTYYYGNNFRPPNQQAMPRDTWFCIEMMAKANTVGTSDGALAFAINGKPIGEYRPGSPEGTWLRDSFHTGGCSFSACTAPVAFEGFDFRASADVKFKSLFLDAYYERNTTASRRAALEAKGLTVLSEQTILYDDVVVATEPIGCGKF